MSKLGSGLVYRKAVPAVLMRQTIVTEGLQMKSYKITKGILDDLFGSDAEYMNDIAQLNVMNTKELYSRLESRRANLEVTAILGLVQEVSERLPEGYTTDYTQVKRWLARQYPEGGLKATIEYLKDYQKEELGL